MDVPIGPRWCEVPLLTLGKFAFSHTCSLTVTISQIHEQHTDVANVLGYDSLPELAWRHFLCLLYGQEEGSGLSTSWVPRSLQPRVPMSKGIKC